MIQLSERVRNGRLDSVETTIGPSPFMDLRTGAQPGTCALADSGTELVHVPLPSDWMGPASAGAKAKLGVWSATSVAAGVPAHFRIKDNIDTNCDIQGSVTAVGGGGDAEIDQASIGLTQVVTVATFTLADANA